MKDDKNNLVSEFRRLLSNSLGSLNHREFCFSVIYHNIFSTMTDTSLNNTLSWLNDVYKEHKEVGSDNWFTEFHKSVRQVDFIQDLECYISDNKLNEDEESLYSELNTKYITTVHKISEEQREILRNMLYSKKDTKESMDIYEKHITSSSFGLTRDEYFEWKRLKALKNKKKGINISAKLDSILWHTISLDTDDYLFAILERTFKLCA